MKLFKKTKSFKNWFTKQLIGLDLHIKGTHLRIRVLEDFSSTRQYMAISNNIDKCYSSDNLQLKN